VLSRDLTEEVRKLVALVVARLEKLALVVILGDVQEGETHVRHLARQLQGRA
jgi:hypothetical protein